VHHSTAVELFFRKMGQDIVRGALTLCGVHAPPRARGGGLSMMR
jgi:hypothetical protein